MHVHITIKTLFKRFYQQYIHSVDPDAIWFLLGLRATVVTLLSLVLIKLFKLPQPIFLVLSAPILMLISAVTDSALRFKAIICGGLAAALGVFAVSCLSNHFNGLLIGLVLYAWVTTYLGKYGQHVLLAGVMALMLTILAAGMPGDLSIAIQRGLYTLLGLALVLAVTFWLFRERAPKKWENNFRLVLREISHYLYHASMDSMRGNYLGYRHQPAKIKVLQLMSKHRQLLTEIAKDKVNDHTIRQLSEKLEYLTGLVLSLVNILNNPLNNATFIHIISYLELFFSNACKVLNEMAAAIASDTTLDLTQFKQTLSTLEIELTQLLRTSEQRSVAFQWPIEISNLLYLLNKFQAECQDLAALIKVYQKGELCASHLSTS